MRLELAFLAPVPIGHEVVVRFIERSTLFGGWEETDPMVLDRTTGIVWTGQFAARNITADNFGTPYVGEQARPRSAAPLVGRVTSCQVISKGIGEHNLLQTVLGVEPLGGGAYR